ncbi:MULTISPECIES: hypothetical protein [unclassified Bradyrhizobium]|uniref:hypothetical protein n=1 Tax=unclassified Bradyrhizobium TaxID=2631580 RepID=UPI0015CC386C|nr:MULTISPECIES: hypothetical protein [unclassified Bradyrhizobium]MBB4263970.1 hypothetical protein [Bradyrhizobium sp. CIR3A]NYG50529.1 hypothetical protein [Bradyrhizobium sp. IAR9]
MPEIRWRPSSVLLAISGILLVGVGIYFLVLRPPLLPEDIRYMSLTPAELQSIGPQLSAWLTHVLRVMGGYVAATGVLALTLAWTSFRDHRSVVAAGAGIAGGLSIGLMAAVNFMIHSDFKWVLLGMALVWAASIVMFIREAAERPNAAIAEGAAP